MKNIVNGLEHSSANHTVDVIASWNFKHMVNYDRIQNYNKINLRFGYPAIDIREPRSLLS